MPYDIYGNDLRRGFCEVHPHVQQEYPCDLCHSDIQRENNRQRTIEQARQKARRPKSETVRIVIDELVKRIPRHDLNQEFIDVDFNGQYLVQIRQHAHNEPDLPNGAWTISNAMNGGGFNCLDEFKDFEVTVLNN